MSVTLELPRHLESELATEASQLGLTLEDYVLQILSRPRNSSVAPKTGAELMEYWKSEHLIGTRPEITDSSAHARELRRRAEIRTKE